MKIIYLFLTLLVIAHPVHAERLIPSKPGSNSSAAREKSFLPWGTQEDEGTHWKELASSNIPVYNEHRAGNTSRSLYIPNPGTGYWSLAGLSEKALWKTNNEKLKIGDELVSATVYTDTNGDLVYWALWAPENKSHLIKDKMQELGITPATVELTLVDKLKAFSTEFAPFLGAAIVAILALQIIVLLLLAVVLFRSRKPAVIVEKAQPGDRA